MLLFRHDPRILPGLGGVVVGLACARDRLALINSGSAHLSAALGRELQLAARTEGGSSGGEWEVRPQGRGDEGIIGFFLLIRNWFGTKILETKTEVLFIIIWSGKISCVH